MTLPNKLTILRMMIVIPFVVLLGFAIIFYDQEKFSYDSLNRKTVLFLISGFIFVFAMFTDFLDGYLARKNNQVTTFGKTFDPIADKFMTTSTLILFSIADIVPFYLTISFILRDIIVDGTRTVAAVNNVSVAASIWGKLKTLMMTFGITIIFFLFPISSISTFSYRMILNIPIIIAALLSLFSGYKYIKEIVPFVKKSR